MFNIGVIRGAKHESEVRFSKFCRQDPLPGQKGPPTVKIEIFPNLLVLREFRARTLIQNVERGSAACLTKF